MPSVTSKAARENLFQEIRNTFLQWSELDQRVFSQAHYHGQSPEAISLSLQLGVEEVNAILKECNHRLNSSIRNFRQNSLGMSSPIPEEAACLIARATDIPRAKAV